MYSPFQVRPWLFLWAAAFAVWSASAFPSTALASASRVAVELSPACPEAGAFCAITVSVPMDEGCAGGVDEEGLKGTFCGRRIHFHPTGVAGRWIALGGVPPRWRASSAVLRVEGRSWWIEKQFLVRRRKFPTESLTVDPAKAAPPRSAYPRILSELKRLRNLASQVTARKWRGGFVRPVPGRVTSPYGERRVFNGKTRSTHLGVDLASAAGKPVKAAQSGRVVLADSLYFGGNTVMIDHGGGLHTVYMHLSSFDVAEGQSVVRGQVIGRVGCTGRVTGPHLHWGACLGRSYFDPLSLLDLPLEELDPEPDGMAGLGCDPPRALKASAAAEADRFLYSTGKGGSEGGV